MKNKLLTLVLLFFCIYTCWGQSNVQIEKELNTLSSKIPALNNAIDISVNNVSIQDFVRAVAQNATVNVNIDPSIKLNVSNDFTQVKVKDILLFLCSEYDLEIEVIGNIVSLKKVNTPVVEKVATKPVKIPFVLYEKEKDLLTLDIFNDTLRNVAKTISDKTGKNLVLAPGIGENIVSAYIKAMPYENVLEKFSFSNDLSIEKTEDNFYLIKKNEVGLKQTTQKDNNNKKNTKKGTSSEDENKTNISFNNNLISIKAEKADLYSLIKNISDKLNINYMLLSDIDGTTSINADNIDYEHFLVKILDGTSYNYTKDGNIYIIGETKNPSLLSTDIYNFQYRTVDKIKDIIPTELTKDVKIIEFTENNSLIMTGNMIGITKLNDFIRQIDKVVPVVLIEITIMDITKYYQFSTGLKAGLGDGTNTLGAPSKSFGSLYPSMNIELSTNAINSVIKGINGLGLINLGNVSSNFYANLQLMEDNGIVKIKSTPKLSTLNGHEASISSGETRYYKEVRSDYIGTQNPSLSSSYNWKPLNADLSITIKPIVSGDGQITLDIQVQQSEFTGRASADEDSPYNSVKRDFQSSIRVKDQEVILLGGLERNKNEDSGSGIPFLSRIPVIKWIFSSRTKTKDSNKLSIFIKPTVIY